MLATLGASDPRGAMMPLEWKPMTPPGVFQAQVTQMDGLVLSVVGRRGKWWWYVRRSGCDLAGGTERTPTAARIFAEDAARGLAVDLWPEVP